HPGPITSRFRANAYAAFRRNIDPESSVHRDSYREMERRLTTEGPVVPFTLPPEAVLKKVILALESRKPKARYYVTFPTYLFATLKRLLPQRTLDRILARV
ncbi:MAG: short-chain dehydrogenase, partial [Gammaproteobacteria bacterium]|nr:short-chain dehydrogenase [Gammaproteobacteria bacterium]